MGGTQKTDKRSPYRSDKRIPIFPLSLVCLVFTVQCVGLEEGELQVGERERVLCSFSSVSPPTRKLLLEQKLRSFKNPAAFNHVTHPHPLSHSFNHTTYTISFTHSITQLTLSLPHTLTISLPSFVAVHVKAAFVSPTPFKHSFLISLHSPHLFVLLFLHSYSSCMFQLWTCPRISLQPIESLLPVSTNEMTGAAHIWLHESASLVYLY